MDTLKTLGKSNMASIISTPLKGWLEKGSSYHCLASLLAIFSKQRRQLTYHPQFSIF
jgi:hypothetical protein